MAHAAKRSDLERSTDRGYRELQRRISAVQSHTAQITKGAVKKWEVDGILRLHDLMTELMHGYHEVIQSHHHYAQEYLAFVEDDYEKLNQLDEFAKREVAGYEQRIRHDPETRRKIEESNRLVEAKRNEFEFAGKHAGSGDSTFPEPSRPDPDSLHGVNNFPNLNYDYRGRWNPNWITENCFDPADYVDGTPEHMIHYREEFWDERET